MTALVIGLGNVDRGDDGVGIEVARRIVSLAPRDVEVVETNDPASLIDLWSGVDVAVVVDATVSHREPGSVACFDVGEVAMPGGGWSSGGTHALGLGAAIELSRALGRLPARLVVVGVEAGSTELDAGLSTEVALVVDDAAHVALDALAALSDGAR